MQPDTIKKWVIGYLAVIFCICLFVCKRRISKTIGLLCSDDFYRHFLPVRCASFFASPLEQVVAYLNTVSPVEGFIY